MAFLFTVPVMAMAVEAGELVPCGGPGQDPCEFCHTVLLVQNVADWLVNISGILVTIIVIVMGVRLASSGGNVDAKSQARRFIATAVIGYMILLSAWFVIDFGLRLFANAVLYDTWSSDIIECVPQPIVQESARPSAIPANNHLLGPADIENRVNAINSSGDLQEDIETAAIAAGLETDREINIMRALISQESGNCQNKVGPPTRYGTAYGCGQMLISTARGLDPNLAGMSDAEVAARLRDDDAYALALSAEYFGQLVDQYDGDTTLALAAYNGGGKANEIYGEDGACPGLRVWECPWNEPGCYNTSRIDCERNEGFSSYEQTRNYVANINAIASAL